MTAVAIALSGLLDDASQFPPGNLPLPEAWEAHLRWRDSERAAIVGRFLVPSARLTAFVALAGDQPAEVGIVVAPGTEPGSLPVLSDAIVVSSIELCGADDLDGWRSWTPGALIALEGLPVESVSTLRTVDQLVVAKLRCGGLDAAAFPTTDTLARFVSDCVALAVPFKATAGLHGTVRHWDAEIGTFHHGFLNLWVATGLAVGGAEIPELIRCLEIETAEELIALPSISIDTLAAAREWFLGFGTCSIEEPLEGLMTAGLLDQ